LSSNIGHSNDGFIKHFKNTYSDPWPPVWVIFEILSMRQFSILYSNTAKSPPRKSVADYFGVKETVLTSWLHTLVYVRNICAHYARLWNKDLRVAVKLPMKTANKWLSTANLTNRKVYCIFRLI
jgi:abortive infection bacteriophage resistance protein